MSAVTPPQQTDAFATFIDGLIKAAVAGGSAAAELYVTAQLPIFADPILQSILDFIIGEIGSVTYKNAADIANLIVFNIQAQGENSSVLQASNAAQAAQASGDAAQIAAANSALITSIGDLVHSDGTAAP